MGRGHERPATPQDFITVGGLEILRRPDAREHEQLLLLRLVGGATPFFSSTVLGRGTTVVAWPDGSLESYLTSLDPIDALTRSRA